MVIFIGVIETRTFLSAAARRRALKHRLENIDRKIAKVREEIEQIEQGARRDTPGLFGQENPGGKALRERLDYLEGVKRGIRGTQVMRKLSIEEKGRISEHLSALSESLRVSQIDIREFGRRVDGLLQFVNSVIERRDASLDERVRGAGDYD